MGVAFQEFTNKYSLSKTIRFELKPFGRTAEYIKSRGLIEQDEIRAEEFQQVKKIFDEYYRFFIDKGLLSVSIEKDDLENFRQIYISLKKEKSDKKLQEQYKKIRSSLRKDLNNQFRNNNKRIFSALFKKDIINLMRDYFKNDDEKICLLNNFDKWTTYFTGFFKNRANMFSSDEKSTSIFYRVIDENLPKFIDNAHNIEELEKLGLDFSSLKKLGFNSYKQFFSLKNYSQFITQEGISQYNLLLGGKTLDNGEKIRGLNELINEFSQKVENQDKKRIKKLQLNLLFKQILSDKESSSFVLEPITEDIEVISSIKDYEKDILKKILVLKNYLNKLSDFDLNKILITSNAFSKISNSLFDDYSTIKRVLFSYAEKTFRTKKEKEGFLKRKYYSIAEIESLLKEWFTTLDEVDKKLLFERADGKHPICNYFFSEEVFVDIEKNKKGFDSLNNFKKDDEVAVQKIKEYLDSLMELLHIIKPLYVESQEALEQDSEFYVTFNELYTGSESYGIKDVVSLYNNVRNYLTKKRYDMKKFKLNFENTQLLNGWDVNKEKDCFGTLLRKSIKGKEHYYLALLTKDNKEVLLNAPSEGEVYEKIDYKLIPNPNLQLPRIIFSKSRIDFFNPSDEIFRIRNSGSFTKNGKPQTGYDKEEFNLEDCHAMIDFYKDCLLRHNEWNHYDFTFNNTKEYQDISEFYKEVSDQAYGISFRNISEKYIDKLVDSGKLYLFQIWNKDFSEYSKGKPNLHTIYWQELFSKENLKNVVYKLNGEAELFYRKASIAYKVTHPKNQAIQNKDPLQDKQGNLKKESTFAYDLVKDKRFTEDKFLFHCPITLNFKASGRDNINIDVLERLKESESTILSIDRGERHLAYWSLLDMNGEILEHGTFNLIKDDKERDRNYHEKLDILEGNRDRARKDWKRITNIKELKEGYLSQVVHKIARMVIEKNAIIVFEDLNFGFKRGRFKIEKQVYQKFEKMLIDKLNYLVFKERGKQELGGSLNAYQLTSKLDSFKKLGKQSGILFFVNANYTSKICPKTGFVNLLYPKYENEKQAKEFVKKFGSLEYLPDENLFRFGFRYSLFGRKELRKDEWDIYSYGTRIVSRKNKNSHFEHEEIDLTRKIKDLFSEHNISLEGDLKKKVLEQEASFMKSFMYCLRLVLQLRNSSDKDDYLLSCAKDKNGVFFDSRNSKDIPNADANGAYHIGIKGMMLVEQIKQGKKPEKITNEDYFNYVSVRCW